MVNRKVEQGIATRRHLLDVARRLFVEDGYASVSTETLVHEAGLTRGALYHHFADKRDVFRALVDEVNAELDQRVARAALTRKTPWTRFVAGITGYLDECLDPVIARFLLLDGPATLGWDEWEQRDMQYSLRSVGFGLRALMASGDIPEQPVEPLAIVLVGALNQMGRAIARSPDPVTTRDELAAAIRSILEGLRAG